MPPGGQAQPGDSGEHHHDQEEGGSSIRQDIWGQSQAEIENDMSAIRDQFKDMFSCIGEIKLPLIEIYMMEGAKPVAQKQRPISIHMMEPLKEKLEEFVQEEVLEGLWSPSMPEGGYTMWSSPRRSGTREPSASTSTPAAWRSTWTCHTSPSPHQKIETPVPRQ